MINNYFLFNRYVYNKQSLNITENIQIQHLYNNFAVMFLN